MEFNNVNASMQKTNFKWIRMYSDRHIFLKKIAAVFVILPLLTFSGLAFSAFQWNGVTINNGHVFIPADDIQNDFMEGFGEGVRIVRYPNVDEQDWVRYRDSVESSLNDIMRRSDSAKQMIFDLSNITLSGGTVQDGMVVGIMPDPGKNNTIGFSETLDGAAWPIDGAAAFRKDVAVDSLPGRGTASLVVVKEEISEQLIPELKERAELAILHEFAHSYAMSKGIVAPTSDKLKTLNAILEEMENVGLATSDRPYTENLFADELGLQRKTGYGNITFNEFIKDFHSSDFVAYSRWLQSLKKYPLNELSPEFYACLKP